MARRKEYVEGLGKNSWGDIKTKARNALRKHLWRPTARKAYIESVRFKQVNEVSGRVGYHVKCEECGKVMGLGSKIQVTNKDGSKRKKKTLAWQVDHIEGTAPLLDLRKDLGEYAYSLLMNKLRILCYECHSKHTSKQTTERAKKRRGK